MRQRPSKQLASVHQAVAAERLSYCAPTGDAHVTTVNPPSLVVHVSAAAAIPPCSPCAWRDNLRATPQFSPGLWLAGSSIHYRSSAWIWRHALFARSHMRSVQAARATPDWASSARRRSRSARARSSRLESSANGKVSVRHRQRRSGSARARRSTLPIPARSDPPPRPASAPDSLGCHDEALPSLPA